MGWAAFFWSCCCLGSEEFEVDVFLELLYGTVDEALNSVDGASQLSGNLCGMHLSDWGSVSEVHQHHFFLLARERAVHAVDQRCMAILHVEHLVGCFVGAGEAVRGGCS